MNLVIRREDLLKSNIALLNDFFSTDLFESQKIAQAKIEATEPSINIKDFDKEIVLEMAAPGLKKNDFKVELINNILSITYENSSKEKNNKVNYSRIEFKYDSFCRSFNLPKFVDIEKIKAVYLDGILSVRIAKKTNLAQRKLKKSF